MEFLRNNPSTKKVQFLCVFLNFFNSKKSDELQPDTDVG